MGQHPKKNWVGLSRVAIITSNGHGVLIVFRFYLKDFTFSDSLNPLNNPLKQIQLLHPSYR